MLTDNEIIKALKCCADHDNIDACDDCPCLKGKCISTTPYVLDLINRQKAEIESKNDLIHRQSDVISEQKEKIESIYAEAVKEFAERLKEMAWHGMWEATNHVDVDDIDYLVKEMVGEG